MSSYKLCVNTGLGFDLPMAERLTLIKKAGFGGFFSEWMPGAPVSEWAAQAKELGLIYQSIHAPFKNVDKIWEEGPEGEAFLKVLMDCVQDCADNHVPLAIIHAIIGFDKHTPSDLGIERFERLCRF